MKKFIICLLAFTQLAVAGLPPSIEEAHHAYLEGNGDLMLEKIRQGLEDSRNHPSVVENLTSLYESAKTNGVLPKAKLKLPAEINYFVIEAQRKYRTSQGLVDYYLSGAIGYQKQESLETFRVVRFPREVVIDRKGVGEIEETENENEKEIWIGGSSSVQPVKEGLYLYHIRFKGKPETKGWFLLGRKNASASPVVLTPETEQTFPEPQPVFHWKEFLSPQYVSSEKRIINVKITEPEEEKTLVHAKLKNPNETSFKVDQKLRNGRYFMHLTYREVEYFGDLEIRRASKVKIPFSVRY